MKKRLINLLMTLVLFVSFAGMTAVAEQDTAPVVNIDGREIVFTDQKPVILENEGRTLVPARGVFECMGASVDWDGEKRLVTINSSNNITRILITIDDPTMVVYTFTSLFSADKTEIILDAAPRIINDRTMIPLRAISETLKATVKWDEATRTIDIFTSDYEEDNNGTSGGYEGEDSNTYQTEEPDSSAGPTSSARPSSSARPTSSPGSSARPTSSPSNSSSSTTTASSGTFDPKKAELSLSASKTKANVGDTIDVYVNVKGVQGKFDNDEGILGVAATIKYDRNVLEYVKDSLTYNTKADVMSVINDKFTDEKLKAVGIFIDTANAMRNDGELLKMSFKVLSDESTSLSLSNGRVPGRGYETYINIRQDNKNGSVHDLNIDKSELKIN